MADDNNDAFFDDTGSAQDQEDRAIRKAAFRNNLKKGGKNALGLAVVVGGFITYSILTAPDPQEQNSSGRANVVNSGGQGAVQDTEVSETSPIAQRQRKAREEQAQAAESQGDTYIEAIDLRNQQRDEERKVEESAAPKKDTGDLALETIATSAPSGPVTPVSRGRTNGPNQPKQPAGWTLKSEIEEAKQLAGQVSEDLKRVAKSQSDYGQYKAFESVSTVGQNGSGGASSAEADSIPYVSGGYGESLAFEQNPSGDSPRTFRVPPDTRLFGITTVAHNSDVGGSMAFESVTPPLDGAVFIANEVPRQGEAVNPQVTSMIYRGETYDVKVLIVNSETFAPGIASEVDHHYLSRWVPYLAGVFGGAYAESLTNRTTTTTPEGNTVNESSGVPDAEERLQYTVGTGLGRAVPILQEQINRPITVTVRNNEEVGIWILSEIEVKQ